MWNTDLLYYIHVYKQKWKIKLFIHFIFHQSFISGERGKPDLILPKYVRNDITLSM